jgi:adhesin transport system membrane fusion protein
MSAVPRAGAGPLSMTILLCCTLAGLLAWAACCDIDQTVRAQGQFIPAARTQLVQAADGGVVASLLVREGQRVTPGQPLATLEQQRSGAALEESLAKEAALSAALTRARAEAAGGALSFDAGLHGYPQFTAAQRTLFQQRQRGLQEESSALQRSIDMAADEVRMNETLFRTGDTSELDVMRARRQLIELQGRLAALRNKFLQDARQEVAKLEDDLTASRYKVDERRNVMAHATLTAPLDGVVKYLRVNTIGAVLRPGDEVMQISPTNGELLLELKIAPADIGQLSLDMPVAVQLDAGGGDHATLHGTLSYISSDTLAEPAANGQGIAFYRAQVRFDALSVHGAIKPGMTATADIRTGTRSVLRYLAKPVVKAFGGALHER